MLSLATRQALRARQAQALPVATTRACFSTSRPVPVESHHAARKWQEAALQQLRQGLGKIMTINAESPAFFEGAQAGGSRMRRERTSQRAKHQKALQRRFQSTSDEELVEALIACRKKASNTYLAGQLFDECDRRNVLVNLPANILSRITTRVFPSTHVWRKSTTLEAPARRAMGHAAVERLATVLRLQRVPRFAEKLATAVHPALFHLAEIGHAESWSRAWSEIAAAGMVNEVVSSDPDQLSTCRLRALMRQSEVAALETPDPAARQVQHQIVSNEAISIFRNAPASNDSSVLRFAFTVRIVKNAGDFKALRRLLQDYAGLNLDCPDVHALTELGQRALSSPHLVNTVLLALVEAGKISQLTALLETISSLEGPPLNSESYEIVLKAARHHGSTVLAQHYFAQATSAMSAHFDNVVSEIRSSIEFNTPLRVQSLIPRTTVTSDLVQELGRATRKRSGQCDKTSELLSACVSLANDHQAAVNTLVESYANLEVVKSEPKTTVNLQTYLVHVATLSILAQERATYYDKLAQQYRERRLRRAIMADLQQILSDDQIKRAQSMLERIEEKHLVPIQHDLGAFVATLPPQPSQDRSATLGQHHSHLLIFNESVKRATDESQGLEQEEADAPVFRAA